MRATALALILLVACSNTGRYRAVTPGGATCARGCEAKRQGAACIQACPGVEREDGRCSEAPQQGSYCAEFEERRIGRTIVFLAIWVASTAAAVVIASELEKPRSSGGN